MGKRDIHEKRDGRVTINVRCENPAFWLCLLIHKSDSTHTPSILNMPRVKERSFKPNLDLEECYKKALQRLQDGTFKSSQKAAIAYGLKKSSLAHRKNDRQSQQEAHSDELVFSPAAERGIVRWILKGIDFGFPPWLNHLIQKVKFSAKNKHQWQVPMGHQQKHPMGKSCITKMYFSLWETPGVSERMWSGNLEASISEEYQTLGGHSGRPSA